MRKLLVGALAIGLGAPILQAEAFTIAPMKAGDSAVQQVRQGCGEGYRRGPYGGCVRQTAPHGPHGANKCWFHNGVKVCR